MSSQIGNSTRTRSQKHKNTRAFKNSQNDGTRLTEMLNNLEIFGVCARCKEQIEWRIKYKKYKTLSASKKCVKCSQKTVKRAYTAACEPCGNELQVCVKCLQPNELAKKTLLSPEEENNRKQRLAAELKGLPERKRRTFARSLQSGAVQGAAGTQEPDTSDSDESDGDDSPSVTDDSNVGHNGENT